MGNSTNKQKITKPQTSTIISIQHKQYESIHDCEELRQLQQLPKTVPLRPSTSYPFQLPPNPAANIGTANLRGDHPQRRPSLSDTAINQFQLQQSENNDIDSAHSKTHCSPQQLITPSIIGSNYSNTSSMRSKSSASDSVPQPFNPTALRPPKLAPDGMDALYKHLRRHFTSLAVKVDCNQVSCTFKIQEMDEKLAITRANMIDIDYTSNQLQRTISCMQTLGDTITQLTEQCNNAMDRVNTLWKLLPSTPRSLPVFTCDDKQRRVVMEGSMLRIGSYLKGNKTRWVVLYADGLMAYYNYERTELKGVIDLMDATQVIPSDICHLMITITKEGNTNRTSSWHFKCPSPQHVTQWLDAIRSNLHFIRGATAKPSLKLDDTHNAIPTQFLRDNTIALMRDRHISSFHMTHVVVNTDQLLYEVCVYSDGEIMHCIYKQCIKQNYNDDREYIDWNLVKNTFESGDEEDHFSSFKSLGSVSLNDDIIAIQIYKASSLVLFATKRCIHSISLDTIQNAITSDSHSNLSCNLSDHVQTIITNDMILNADHVQRIKIIRDIEIVVYNAFELVFICDSMEHCLWCFHLENKTFIKLINSPSPNGVTLQNDILYITSLQCGIYCIALKDIDFAKAFASPSFFSPYMTQTLQIFENIVLREIISMRVPPSDLRPPESPSISHMSNHSSSSMDSSNVTDAVSTHTSSTGGGCASSILFVMDIEYRLYIIRLTDLLLISFGIIHNAHQLFYYPNFDHLYITKPADHRIDCICNVYHEIVSVRSSASAIGAANTPTHSSSATHSNDKLPPPLQLDKPSVQILNTAKTATTTTTKQPPTNHNHKKNNKHKHKRKQLSDADIRALNKQNGRCHDTKKLCFPKSLYLVYASSCILREEEDESKGMQSVEDVDMEILVEVDNMLQSYMLSELRQYSKRLLSYMQRNYSFLYLYTSPYDGQSAYRELDANYESSVPAKNLIQHSSIGPVILVKLKPPTKQQMRKQRERDLKLKKKEKRNKNKHETY